MNTELLSNITKVITEIGEDNLINILKDLENKLNNPFSPKILLVSNEYSKTEVFETLCSDVGDKFKEYIFSNKNKFILSFVFGDENIHEDIISFGNKDYTRIFFSSKQDYLKNISIEWICGVDISKINTDIVTDSDIIILVTNATMAMTYSEKEWLKNVVVPVFPAERVGITLCGKKQLNTKEDFSSLCESMSNLLKSIDSKLRFYSEMEKVLEIALNFSKDENAEEMHKRNLIKGFLFNIENCVIKLLEETNVDSKMLNENLGKLKEECKCLELSSRLILETTIENRYSILKSRIVNSVDKYNDDVYNKIREKVKSTKSVKNTAGKIHAFVQKAWEYFEDEINKKIIEEQRRISVEVACKVEEDCNQLINTINVDKKNLKINYDLAIWTSNVSEVVLNDNKKERIKLVTLASLFFFVKGFSSLSIAIFASSKLFSFANGKNEDVSRQEMLDGLHDKCNELKKSMVSQISVNIDNAKEISKQNLGKVYLEEINSMVASISKFVEQINTVNNNKVLLKNLIEKEMPIIKNMI